MRLAIGGLPKWRMWRRNSNGLWLGGVLWVPVALACPCLRRFSLRRLFLCRNGSGNAQRRGWRHSHVRGPLKDDLVIPFVHEVAIRKAGIVLEPSGMRTGISQAELLSRAQFHGYRVAFLRHAVGLGAAEDLELDARAGQRQFVVVLILHGRRLDGFTREQHGAAQYEYKAEDGNTSHTCMG